MSKPASTSHITFYDCPECRGFGYAVTGNRKHVPCAVCHQHPSMFGVCDEQVWYWGAPITRTGIAQRHAQKIAKRIFNILLLLCGALGVVALGYALYRNVRVGGYGIDVFTQPQVLVAAFWCSVIIDAFLYYRLDREAFSKKQFDYSEHGQARAEQETQQRKKILQPNFEKYHALPHHHKTDLSAYYTQDCFEAIEHAFVLAKKLSHHQITPLHLFAGLLEAQTIRILLARLNISGNDVFKRIGSAMAKEGMEKGSGIDIGLETQRIFFFAYEEARQDKRPRVDVTSLFLAVVQHDPWVQEILEDLEVDDRMIQHVIAWIHLQQDLRAKYQQWSSKASNKPHGIMDRAMTARPSPLLESISQDYSAIASMGGFFPLVGRVSEMDQVLRILRSRTGNVLLVGPAGAGKSTLMEGIGELMASEDVPKELQDKRFVVVDPGAIVAKASGVGTVEGRMVQVIQEMSAAGNILFGVEDVHHLLNMRSTSGSEDVGAILMNAMSQGFVKVVATTTTPEYQQFIINYPQFLRRFQVVKVEEMTRDDAIEVLEARSGSIEYKNKVFFSYAAIESAVDLTTKFIQDRYLPAKALDVITETAALVQGTRGDNSFVNKEDVARVMAEKTNVQLTAITEDERDKLLHLEEVMHERIVGQDEAVSAIAKALRRAREGLRDAHRPIANLLFLGPTGVGKTETAKTIAEVYFGSESNMIRLDMSEYQSITSLSKLIGGKGERGFLTESVRLHPFSIVLLDEIEKAHPNVLNIFLQVMDDGRVTDGKGQTFDMSNTMIIATSNAGSQQIQNSITAGLSHEQLKNQLLQETLPQIFRPEFLNRFDNVVVFTPLSLEQIVEIARVQLRGIAAQLLEQKGITLEVADEAVFELARAGYDPQYGARPLKRVIQDTLDDALAQLLLSQQISRRDTVMLLSGGRMEIRKGMQL